MGLRQGTYFIVTPRGNTFGFYESLPVAKGVRTREFKGKGDIYRVNLSSTGPSVGGPVGIMVGG